MSTVQIPLRKTEGVVASCDLDLSENLLAFNWCIDKDGYATRTIQRADEPTKMHQWVMRLSGVDVPDGYVIDHINQDRLDNRRCNLRVITIAQNNQNRMKRSGGTSQYKGVSYQVAKAAWAAGFELTHLGYFESEQAAAYAYDQAVLAKYPDGCINGVSKPLLNAEPRPSQLRLGNPKGVRKCGNRWAAVLWKDGRDHYVGYFDSVEEAATEAAEARAVVEEQKRLAHLAKPIERNADGVAIVRCFTKGAFIDVLLDDDDWHRVTERTWSVVEGYISARIDKKNTRLHHYLLGAPSGSIVDHINHVPLDNRKSNLRLSNARLNGHNKQKRKTPTSSKYIGVSQYKSGDRWIAYLSIDNKQVFLGSYPSQEVAAWVRDCRAKEVFGEFAKLNHVAQPASWVYRDQRGVQVCENAERAEAVECIEIVDVDELPGAKRHRVDVI